MIHGDAMFVLHKKAKEGNWANTHRLRCNLTLHRGGMGYKMDVGEMGKKGEEAE